MHLNLKCIAFGVLTVHDRDIVIETRTANHRLLQIICHPYEGSGINLLHIKLSNLTNITIFVEI